MKKPVPLVSGVRRHAPVSTLDRHALYEVAVQGVDWDLDFLERVWRYRHPGREPKLFREDFCSTAALATAWARRGPDRRARAWTSIPNRFSGRVVTGCRGRARRRSA